jgi:hypothetical protein
MSDRKPGQLLLLRLEFVSSEKEIKMCHFSCHSELHVTVYSDFVSSTNNDFHNPRTVVHKIVYVVRVDLTCDLSRNTQVSSITQRQRPEHNTSYVDLILKMGLVTPSEVKCKLSFQP